MSQAELNSNTVMLYKYLTQYKKDTDYQKYKMAQMRVKSIKHNKANYVKSPFLPQALEALKEMKNPEV
jgi:hypothetical protein